MGITVAFEFGNVGFGFLKRDLFLFEIRLVVFSVVICPGLITAKMRKMRDDLMQARDMLSRKR